LARLDFLGLGHFAREDPISWLLDSLGFPWILSSESKLINGLRGINRARLFSALLSRRAAGNGGHGGRGNAESQNSHEASPTQLLFFVNRLSSDKKRYPETISPYNPDNIRQKIAG
jgi:hypothetical protein